MLIIQEIVTRWTKESRGAPGATLRNQVPEFLSVPMPREPMTDESWIYQKSIFDEYRKFEEPFEQLDVITPFKLSKFGIADISEREIGVLVDINYGAWEGAPRRDFLKKKAFQLDLNDVGKINYNWRIAYDEGGWAYQKTVINMALLNDFVPEIFITKDATQSFEDMPNLW